MAIKTRRLSARASLVPLLAFAMLFWTGNPASGQTVSTQDQQAMPPQTPPPQAMPPEQNMPPQHVGDNDTTRRDLAEMDQFLDSHPEVAEQLRKDPSLINNEDFVDKHPGLREFLQNHPGVREEFKENPNAFMRQENRYERHEGDDRDRDSDRDRDRRDGDTTHRELASMDRFMDGHPEIAEQLRKNPSLINNREFVENHPALQEYLQSHPEVREEFKENPNAFMKQENRYERHEGDDRDHGRRDGDTTHRELASMDRFMDGHPEIAEQLRKNPSLVNNREFVENHPALQEYLQSHPQVREEFKENPNAFMRQENRYDRREDDRDRGISTDARGERNRMGDPEGRGELTSFGQFLGGHSTVAEQLSKDPSLANNKEYLANHPELGEYLKAHPAMTRQLSENPQAVMSSNWVLQGSSSSAGKTNPPKGKPNQ